VTTRTILLALGAIATLLLAVIVWDVLAGTVFVAEDTIPPVAAPLPAKQGPAPPTPPDQTDAWLATVLARPLFSRDRRPTEAGAKAASAKAPVLPRLTGVIVGPFGRTAIFAAGDGDKGVAVVEGKMIGPYTIEAIEPGGITVSGPQGRQRVMLSGDAKLRDTLVVAPPPAVSPLGLPQPPGAQPPGPPQPVPSLARAPIVPGAGPPPAPINPDAPLTTDTIRPDFFFRRPTPSPPTVRPGKEGSN
jgi:hypothetical protein